MSSDLKKFLLGGDNPPLAFLLMSAGWSQKNAMLAAAIVQVIALLLLIFAVAMFYEWRFVQWEQLGCSAYCNCTSRLANMTFSF